MEVHLSKVVYQRSGLSSTIGAWFKLPTSEPDLLSGANLDSHNLRVQILVLKRSCP